MGQIVNNNYNYSDLVHLMTASFHTKRKMEKYSLVKVEEVLNLRRFGRLSLCGARAVLIIQGGRFRATLSVQGEADRRNPRVREEPCGKLAKRWLYAQRGQPQSQERGPRHRVEQSAETQKQC